MRRFRWDRLLKCLALVAGLILLVWIGASFLDTANQEGVPDPEYKSWNLFAAQQP